MSENIQNKQSTNQAASQNVETKKCKHCQSDIPKKAKVCPVCKKKQGSVLKWILVIVFALAIIGVVTSNDNDNSNNISRADSQNTDVHVPESSSQSEEQELVFRVGETAEYKDVQVTLLNITESTGSQFNKPTDGNVFILAEFEIANNSDKELAISSLMCFDAYQDGYATNISLTALIENPGEQLDGSIAPGKKMKGAIGYEIPSDYKELEINVQLDIWSSTKIVFVYEK